MLTVGIKLISPLAFFSNHIDLFYTVLYQKNIISQYRIVNASNCQLISFAVNRLGYLVLPKSFQKNASHPFGFFNAHRFTKASFRHRFALKKPLTFVRGFVSRSRAGSNRCRSFCRALPNHSATGPFWDVKLT